MGNQYKNVKRPREIALPLIEDRGNIFEARSVWLIVDASRVGNF